MSVASVLGHLDPLDPGTHIEDRNFHPRRDFHLRAEGFVPAKERGNSSAADAALPSPPPSQPPPEPLRGGSPRGKQPARDLDRDSVRV